MTWLDLPFTEISCEEVYKKDGKLKKEDVENLKEWMAKQPHLPSATELQLLLFLQSCFYNMELTKRCIDVYFTARTLSPDMFGGRTLQDDLLNTAAKCALCTALPTRTPGGDAVVLGKLIDYNPANYDPVGQYKLFDVCALLYLHRSGPVEGVQIIIDMSNTTFGHLLKLNPNAVRKFLYYLQEGMPIRLRYVHLINVVSFLDKVLSIMKPFMKKELFDSIKVHNNIESLFEFVPKNILPAEYDGSNESSGVLHDKLLNLLKNSEDFLKFQESQVIDKSKRPKIEEFEQLSYGVAGTFKKLELD